MKDRFFYVYILFSFRDRKLYIGYTENLDVRVKEHLQGKVRATKGRLPLVLIYYEAFTNRKDAKAREKFLKSGFDAYIAKPASLPDFRQTVERFANPLVAEREAV